MKKKLAIFTAAVGFFTLCNVVLYTRKLRSDEMARFWHWSALTVITNCSGNGLSPDDQSVMCGNATGGAPLIPLTIAETNVTWRRRQHHRDIPPEGRSRDRNKVKGDDPPSPGSLNGNTSDTPSVGVSDSPAPGQPWPAPGPVTLPGIIQSPANLSRNSSPSHLAGPIPATSPPSATANPQAMSDRPHQSSTVAGAPSPQPPPSPAPLPQPSRHRQQQFVLDNRTFYIGDGADAEVHLPVPLPSLNLTVTVRFGVSLLDDIVAKSTPSSTASTPVSVTPSGRVSGISVSPVVRTVTGSTTRLSNVSSVSSPGPTAMATTTTTTSGGLTILNQHPFRYLIDVQDLCGGGHQVTLLVMVTTSVSHFEHRQAIRDTWGTLARNGGAAAAGVRLVFVMGRPADPAVEPAVVREAIRHADIVQEDFLDTYKNLTLKTMMLLKWAHTHCPRAKFLMKSDDDMFIHLPNLLKYLRNLRQTKSQLFGRLVKGARPLRSKSSKYFVPVSEYQSHVYPDYLSGTAYVMSSDVAPRLLSTASKTPIFFFEDVFITGICAKKAGLVRRNHVGFVYYKRPVKGCAYAKVISGHNNTPNDLRNIWKDLQKKTKC